jgi:hypothetical protein
MPQDHKDITIGEHQYKIGQLKAADGSWIYSTFVKRYRAYREAQPPASEEAQTAEVPQEIGFAMTAQFLVEQLTREEVTEVQRLCLLACGRYSGRTGTPIAMPIIRDDGRYAIPDLEFDGPTVYKLTQESIAFNIAPFFPGAGSNANPATNVQEPSTQP